MRGNQWMMLFACCLFLGLPCAVAEEEAPPEAYTERIPGTETAFEMVPIPDGTFLMGSPEDEAPEHRGEDEGPRIEVEVEPFWMGKHEVTWGEYRHFMKEYEVALVRHDEEHPKNDDADAVSLPTPPYAPEAEGMYPGLKADDWGITGFDTARPAVGMTQFAAKQYTKWLSKKTGRFHRLPTEAEWEYAARAGTKTAYSFGDDPDDLADYAWFYSEEADEAEGPIHPVGRKKPNPWGLYDMHGNVAEWVIDQYVPDHYEQFAGEGVVNAMDVVAWPTEEYPRVVRGGSWWHFEDELRSAWRGHSRQEWKELDPEFPKSIWWHTSAPFIGFRIVRPVEEPGEEEKRRYWKADIPWIKDIIDDGFPNLRMVIEPEEGKGE